MNSSVDVGADIDVGVCVCGCYGKCTGITFPLCVVPEVLLVTSNAIKRVLWHT